MLWGKKIIYKLFIFDRTLCKKPLKKKLHKQIYLKIIRIRSNFAQKNFEERATQKIIDKLFVFDWTVGKKSSEGKAT